MSFSNTRYLILLTIIGWSIAGNIVWGQGNRGWQLTPSDSSDIPKIGWFFHPFSSTVSGIYKLGCELPASKGLTYRGTIAVGFPADSRYFEVYRRRSIGIEGHLRYYFYAHQWRGLYGAIYGLAKYMTFNTLPATHSLSHIFGPIHSLNQYPYYPDNYNQARAIAFSIGPAIGYHYDVDANIIFDMYLGLGYQSATISGSGTVRIKADHPINRRLFESYRSGATLHCGISVGLIIY